MTHLPKNIHCEACLEAKTQAPPARKGALRRKPRGTVFGDLITVDHAVPHIVDAPGMDGERFMLAIRDFATGWIECMPVRRKSGPAAYNAFLEFLGTSKLSLIYSDNSKELQSMCRLLKVVHRTSTPRYPRNSALAERTVRTCLEGMRAIMAQSGLPEAFWSYAARHFTFSHNALHVGCAGYREVVEFGEDGEDMQA